MWLIVFLLTPGDPFVAFHILILMPHFIKCLLPRGNLPVVVEGLACSYGLASKARAGALADALSYLKGIGLLIVAKSSVRDQTKWFQ